MEIVTSNKLPITSNFFSAQRHREHKVAQRKSVIQLFSYSVIQNCILTILCLSVSFASAQTVSYTYDASGNRTHRTINWPALTPPPQDSTENAVDEVEDPFAYAEDVENEDENLQETNNNKKTQQEIYTDALAETFITIYPNPTTGLLTVKFTNKPQDAVSNLTLFDTQGRVVTQQQSLSDENKLNIGSQPAGTYIMQIAVGEEVTNWKIVKQ